MARFAVTQSGSALQILNTTTGVFTSLTLPTDVTLDATLMPRFAVYNKYVVLVNSPSRPLIIDLDGVVRLLTPQMPSTLPALSGVAGGSLTGTYLVKQSFRVEDADGNVITESDTGSAALSASITANYLKASNLDVSVDSQITSSKLYRTTTGGSTFFPWFTVDGNTQNNAMDDLSDALLDNIAMPILGSAPDLTLIAEWRGRLWGVARSEPENLRFTEAGRMYAWGALNTLPIPRLGEDSRGVIALAARREALVVGRRNSLHQIAGNSLADFRPIKISENVGIESQETVKVYRDTAYFLWKDGVYELGSDGVKCISDGKVRSWFTTDSYFNRARFQYAFGMIDPIRNRYILFLANAGDSVENRWVEYDINDKTWWGPHKTDAVTTLTSSFIAPDANDVLFPVIGNSTGFLWKQQATATDDTATGIALDVDTKFFDGLTPDIEKYWGELSIIGKVQSAGTLTITPKAGYLDAVAQTAISHTMSTGRQRLRRIGTGKLMQLNFSHSTAGEPVEIYGVEVPYHELGRR